MSGDIPLKIRVAIRDQYESSRAPIRNSIDSLTRVLGYVITPQVEWPTLYGTLKDTFSEPSTFVPAICRIVIAFYGRLLSRLENENNHEWTEKFLDRMAKADNWRLCMEVNSDGVLQRPRLVWDTTAGVFCIHVPPRKPAGNAVIEAGFDDDLDGVFANPMAFQVTPPLEKVEEEPEPESPKQDRRSDLVGIDPPQEQVQEASPIIVIPVPPTFGEHTASSTLMSDELPPVDLMIMPGTLFKARAPYVLTVDAEKVPLRIQGSHQSSLEYISAYLKKWARLDQNSINPQPLLKVEMIESAFFSNVIDAISIEPSYTRGDPQPLNPVVILGFIEGVLGYREMYTNGSRWVFRL